MEIVNSIYKEDIVKNIFLSSSPLPSFVIYINNKFECYNINCENINIELAYYNIIIENENNLNKDNEISKVNNIENDKGKKIETDKRYCIEINKAENMKSIKKKCKIEYHTFNKEKYLKEENKYDINNALVITNNNFVDYLLYEFNNNIIIRKFPFMNMIQTIQFKSLNKCLIVENSINILFIHLESKEQKINIKSKKKNKLGNNQSNLFDDM